MQTSRVFLGALSGRSVEVIREVQVLFDSDGLDPRPSGHKPNSPTFRPPLTQWGYRRKGAELTETKHPTVKRGEKLMCCF